MGVPQASNIYQPGQTAGTQNPITVPLPVAQIVTLYGVTGGSTASGLCFPLFKNGAAYQVGGSKYFHILSITSLAQGTTTGFQIVTSTTAITNAEAYTSLGSVVSMVAQSGGTTESNYPMATSSTSLLEKIHTYQWEAGSSAYVGFQTSNATQFALLVTGYEDTNP